MDNVLFICLDGCGYDTFISASTPNIDKICGPAKAVHSFACFTLPSVIGHLQGFPPIGVGHNLFPEIGGNWAWTASAHKEFRKLGYTTAFLSPNPWMVVMDKEFRFFSKHCDVFKCLEYSQGPEGIKQIGADIAKIVTGDKPVFMYILLLDTHSPFPSATKGGSNRERQIETVEYVDSWIPEIIRPFKESGRDTRIILTADHAELLGPKHLGHDPRSSDCEFASELFEIPFIEARLPSIIHQGNPSPIMLHFVNTGKEFPYPYYLAVLSALKTQKVGGVNLWLTVRPTGKCFDAIKDKVNLIDFPVLDFPALRGRDEHFRAAHLADYVVWKVLHEHGGIFADLDVLFLKDLSEILRDSDKEIVTFIDLPDAQDEQLTCSNSVVMAHKGSEVMKKVLDRTIKLLYQDNIQWGDTGPTVLNDIIRQNLDMVKVLEFGVSGYSPREGWAGEKPGDGKQIHKMFAPASWLEPDQMQVRENARWLHLYAKLHKECFDKITEEWVESSDSIYARSVREIIPLDERMVTGMDTDVHFISTGRDFPYPYYLAVASALKTQKAKRVTLWLTQEPQGKYFDLVKGKAGIIKVDVPNFPALRNKDENFRSVHTKDYLTWKILYEHGGVALDLDTLCLKDISDLLGDKEVLAPMDVQHIDDCPKPFNSAIVAAKQGSGVIKQILDTVTHMLNQPDVGWGDTGPAVFSDVVKEHLDKVRVAEFGLCGGFGGNEILSLYRDDGILRDNARIVHLFAYASGEYFTRISEDYVATSNSLYARLVRDVLPEEDKRMRTHPVIKSYEIKNTLLPLLPHREVIMQQLLDMYNRGEDLTESPFVQWGRQMIKDGKWWYSQEKASDIEEHIQSKQQEVISLYHDLKDNGYNGSHIMAWFDNEGRIQTYDGYNRLTIMKYLGMETNVNVDMVPWIITAGRDGEFPLVSVLMSLGPEGKQLYQQVLDVRVKDFPVQRADSSDRLSYILGHIKGETVLDIGCHEGYFSIELAKRGYKVTALDTDPRCLSVTRYLATINGVEVDCRVGTWQGFLEGKHYDNILFLSVFHHSIREVGGDQAFMHLEKFRGKADRVFFEMPLSSPWAEAPYSFTESVLTTRVEASLAMPVMDTWHGERPVFLLEGSKAMSLEDEIKSWLASKGQHYGPLFDYLIKHPCKNIMEIGTHDGENAIHMIKAAAAQVPENQVRYYGFDLFEELTQDIKDQEFSYPKSSPMAEVRKKIKSGTKARVSLIKGNTKETLPKAIGTLPGMDLIYIDGGHSIETIRNDWGHALKLMGDSTVVFMDDYFSEMAFIGCKFLLGELDPKEYTAEILPTTDTYRQPWGDLKTQLVVIQKGAKPVIFLAPTTHRALHQGKFRLHILGLAHTRTTKEFLPCAYTQKVLRMCQMMSDRGHEVYHYGAEGSNPACTEHIDVVSSAVQKKVYGDYDWRTEFFKHDPKDLAYQTFNMNAIREISNRKQPRDLLLVSMGNYQKPIVDVVAPRSADIVALEMGIGYTGVFLDKRVFESYPWMHYIYGMMYPSDGGCDGLFYDAVIPNYYDPEDFEFSEEKEDYYLFVGRLISRKGLHVAQQVVDHIGGKLIVAGQGKLSDVGITSPNVEHIGTIDAKQRSDLMRKAKATFVPTLYLEPFGGVAVESMFCGTPVITTDFGAFVDTVQHGVTGYRCKTFDDFVWAAKNVDKLKPEDCRRWAESNYSMGKVSLMYEEYFSKVLDLFGKGWYENHPERVELDWLKKVY